MSVRVRDVLAPLMGHTLLLEDDAGCDASWLLHHALVQHLEQGDGAVVLVAAAHALSHYAAVARKLGVNLADAASAGRFAFVDALRDADAAPASLLAVVDQHAAGQRTAGRQPLLLLDDTLPCALHHGEAAAATLVRALARRRRDGALAACVVLAHTDAARPRHVAALRHLADRVLRCVSLDTGATAGVHAQLVVRERDSAVGFQYSVGDSGARVFAAGTGLA